MEELFLRFSHLTENIFDQLDNKSLANCMLVNHVWHDYLSNQKLLQIRKITVTVTEFHKLGDSWERIFEKATTLAIMGLEDATRQFYNQ